MDPNRESPAPKYYNFMLERDLNDSLESWRSGEVEFVAPELPTIAGSIERHPLHGSDLMLTLFVRNKTLALTPHSALNSVAVVGTILPCRPLHNRYQHVQDSSLKNPVFFSDVCWKSSFSSW